MLCCIHTLLVQQTTDTCSGQAPQQHAAKPAHVAHCSKLQALGVQQCFLKQNKLVGWMAGPSTFHLRALKHWNGY